MERQVNIYFGVSACVQCFYTREMGPKTCSVIWIDFCINMNWNHLWTFNDSVETLTPPPFFCQKLPQINIL